jgi:hypothetical protein
MFVLGIFFILFIVRVITFRRNIQNVNNIFGARYGWSAVQDEVSALKVYYFDKCST